MVTGVHVGGSGRRIQAHTGPMFERFDEGARRSVVLAEQEAAALGHDYIGTEHLLIALVAEGSGVAAAALVELRVDADAARIAVERVVGRGKIQRREGRLPFTPRAKRVLELSIREALNAQDDFIATEHVLLALLREGEGVGIRVLGELGVDREQARVAVLGRRGLPTEPPAAAASPPHTRPKSETRIDRLETTLQQILQQQEAILRSIDQLAARLPPSDGGSVRGA